MMTAEDFRDELERDVAWRSEELSGLKNLLTFEKDSDRRDTLRKSLVVLLYSHFEGFVVFALQHYQVAINSAAVRCGDATPAILAGAWEGLFNAMQYGDTKNKFFSTLLPDDAALHRHWRRRHFVEEINEFSGRVLRIPDNTVDAESNLKPKVFRRNLFVLGLDHEFVAPHEGTINNLLSLRNRIAHGDMKRGVAETEYNKYQSAVDALNSQLITYLNDAYRQRRFVKP